MPKRKRTPKPKRRARRPNVNGEFQRNADEISLFRLSDKDKFHIVTDRVEVEIKVDKDRNILFVKNLTPEKGLSAYRAFDAVILAPSKKAPTYEYGMVFGICQTWGQDLAAAYSVTIGDNIICAWSNHDEFVEEEIKQYISKGAFFMIGNRFKAMFPAAGYLGVKTLDDYMCESLFPYLPEDLFASLDYKSLPVSVFIETMNMTNEEFNEFSNKYKLYKDLLILQAQLHLYPKYSKLL